MNMVYVRCTRCARMIDVSDAKTYLEGEGTLVRIRCREEKCRKVDWYSKAEFGGTPPLPGNLRSDLGESKTQWYDLLTSGV